MLELTKGLKCAEERVNNKDVGCILSYSGFEVCSNFMVTGMDVKLF